MLFQINFFCFNYYIFFKFNSQSTIRILWIIGAVANIGTIFIMYDKQISVLTTSIYVALSKPVWGLGIGWIIIACSTGHGGIISLIRIFYCSYYKTIKISTT